MTNKIEKLIVKYLTNSATVSELGVLTNWISNPANERLFKEYVKTYYAIICSMNNSDHQKTIEQLLRTIRKEKSFVHRLKTNAVYKYTAAASIAILITAGIWFFKTSNTEQFTEPIIVNNQIEIGTDKATLTLEDGTDVTLIKGQTYKTQNATSNGEQIIYNNSTSRELVNNYLTTARGEQYQITLADGTQVWLNSETQLKYPVSFTDGESRQVELVYGEAYFDVSPSINHKGSKFKVYNNDQEVEVLGTEFNIKAYKDENNIYTTLVEGSVVINAEGTNSVLKPGEQSNFNINTKTIQVIAVDTFREVAWKDGIFSFKNKSLKEIMTTLSRWYDMDVVFENKELKKVSFNGTLYKTQSVEDILSFLQNSIKTYEINNKTITLK
ncbi:FecR family protein [Flavivirga sp. 57AJ16]|uniref:FecR family protein n=1 Tax=Flavivirga sp. 57AJ16 TaxID=3025307 RepID=UPI002365D3D1|nr:FecR domain-containing protein [Flavivirga sp. 57AJ16]MDD7888135.1 FecR domain-containing protein [Flavivirga sp. 57AJ16]